MTAGTTSSTVSSTAPSSSTSRVSPTSASYPPSAPPSAPYPVPTSVHRRAAPTYRGGAATVSSRAPHAAATTLAHPTGVPGATLDGTARSRTGPDDRGVVGTPARAVVVGVVGACGGVGASTLAAAVAAAGTQDGLLAVLVDARHAGAGIDVLLGIEQEPGLRWADLHDARGEVDPGRLLDLLPRWAGVHVLSTDRARGLARPDEVEHDVLRAVVSAADLVVLDLPAGRVAGLARSCDVAVVVARCETLSVAGAQSLGADLATVPSGLVCRRSAAGRLLPHDVAAAAGLELWGETVTDPRVAAAVEAGAGPTVRAGRDPAPRGRGRVGGRRGRPPGERGAARRSLGYVARTLLSHAQAVAAAQAGR